MTNDLSNTMAYWNNGDGTFTVRAWEVTFKGDHPGYLVYTQKIALDKFAEPGALEMNLRLLVRNHRPAVGVEITRPGDEPPAPAVPQSGYTPCACRDCMDTTVSSAYPAPLALCSECEEAGCLNYSFRANLDYEGGSEFECQRDDAYDDSVGDAGTGHGAYEYHSGA